MRSRGAQEGRRTKNRERRRRRREKDVTTFIDPTPKSTCKEIHLWKGIDVLAASDLWPRIFSLSIRILLYIANGGRRRGRRWRKREELKVEGESNGREERGLEGGGDLDKKEGEM